MSEETNSFPLINIGLSLLYVLIALMLTSVMKMNLESIFNYIQNNKLVEKNIRYKKRSDALKTLSKNISTFIIWLTLFASLLTLWKIDIKPLLAGIGIAGLSLGVGAQTYLRNIISGVLILLDQYYYIGDTIDVSGVVGEVTDINLQSTILRNEKGESIIIPNGNISVVIIKSTKDDSK